ncbi:MAG TPA: TetR/AcrR family transcriptional regulator [Candidatus Binataceae bacterium]|nr:TetR/AcrR family transcriptional regulator [Candidatus Binataceae bacterium]
MDENVKSPNQDEALAAIRRRQIFLAACRVLASKSFHQATVKEIAVEAGIAAGSIYLYLRSKDEILLLLAESMVGELAESFPEIRQKAEGDPRRELLGIMRAALDVIDRYREAFAVLNHEVRYLGRRQQYRAPLNQILEPYLSALGNVLERGRDQGLMTFADVNSVIEAVHMLCSGWASGTGILLHTEKETYWQEIASIIEGRFLQTANPSS